MTLIDDARDAHDHTITLPVAELRGTPASIVADGVSAWFGDHQVLDDVTLTMPAGRVTALIGPSGCGKSTFLYILGGFVEPSGGSVAVGGRLGIVFQEPALFGWKTVLGNIAYGLPRR